MRRLRPLLAVSVLVGLSACGSNTVTLPPCWRAADLQQGKRFHGFILIFAAPNIRPMMFPVACDGGVTADLPNGLRLPVSKEGEDPDAADEGLFYEAYVDGEVAGTAFERPSVRLDRVISPTQVIPGWSRPKVR